MITGRRTSETWPSLPLDDWRDTQETLHLWTQIVGKVKLELTSFLNEWWNVAFAVTPRGLTTGAIPTGDELCSVDFDFIDHNLLIHTSDGRTKELPLIPQTVANFYAGFMTALDALDIRVTINPMPVEIPNPIAFNVDRTHASYDPEPVHRWWRILVQAEQILQRYRSPFAGKSSPIMFFWGSFDLNATRFSGRPAPLPVGAPRFLQLAEDQENVACGFWPGNANYAGITIGEPAFYSYIYPEPPGFKQASIRPRGTSFHPRLGQFVLPYDEARLSASPENEILEFLQSTYEAAATLAAWNRETLEHNWKEIG